MKFRWAASTFVFCIFSGSFLLATPVHADDSQVRVLVGDVCPNIPGNQPIIPSGMEHDEAGNCFTPSPPPPPDACPNLPGEQTAIPNGYYRAQNGNCVTQTTPAKDVCPNLSGQQRDVPHGMQTASNGDCIWPPNDVCANIPGPQNEMPKGMQYDKTGSCVTPTTTEPYKTPPSASPKPTPYSSLPYYLIGALAFVALLLLLQTLRESFATNGIILLFKRRKHLAEEKDQFIMLTIQYLRTILANMTTSLASSQTATNQPVDPLLNATRNLQAAVETTLANDQTSALESANVFTRGAIHAKVLLSPLFWLPTLVTAAALVGVTILLNTSGPISISNHYLWAQTAAFLVVSFLFFLVLRLRRIHHLQHRRAEELANNERSIDDTRNSFIEQASTLLETGLRDIDASYKLLADMSANTSFHEGYIGLVAIHTKLNLLRSMTAGSDRATKLNIRDVLDNCLLRYQTSMDAKKLSITDTVDRYDIIQNRELLDFVIGSIIDNAIKFNIVGGNIALESEPGTHKQGVELRITNTGKTLTDEEQSILNSVDGAQHGSYGLSLFLDKIIMSYLGGEVRISSDPNKKTTTVAIRA